MIAAGLLLGLVHFGVVPVPESLGVRDVVGGPLKVVIVVDRHKPLPAAQQDAINSAAAEAYLATHAAKDSTQRPAVRCWEAGLTAEQITDDAELETMYVQAVSISNGTLPWVMIVSGSRMKSCAFPADETAWLALLKSLGGA